MICEKCNKNHASERHHRMSNTKQNRQRYGDLLDSPINIQHLCYSCHHNEPLDKLSEIAFCSLHNIVPRSKTGKIIYDRIMKFDNKKVIQYEVLIKK